MKLSVVIVSYNVKHFLEQCLYSVHAACAGIETELFVVDNASVDGSVKMVKEKFPEANCIANQDNAGFAKANNQAIRQSTGEYVLLLNPDTIVETDTFVKIIAFMDSHSDAGGLGVKMVDGTGKFLPESKRGLPTPGVAFCKVFGLSRLFPKSKTFNKYHLGYLDKDKPPPLARICNPCRYSRKTITFTKKSRLSRKYKFHNPDGVYFVTFAVHGWVDVFTRNEYKDILIDNLAYCQKNKGLEIFAWCIMTNHVHLIVRAEEGHTLSDILRDYKKFTSKAVLKAIAENQRESRKEWLVKQFETEEGNRFWRADNHPVELWSNAVIAQKLTYIHQNPVEEGLVFRAEEYVYSSATDYAGNNGLLDILVI